MAYSLPTSDLTLFLSELNKIRRGIHGGFKGDGIENADGLLLRLCHDDPTRALEIASEIEACVKSGITSMVHPSRMKQFANTIRKNIQTNTEDTQLISTTSNRSEFARLHGVSQQTMHERIKAGWVFGVLDGEDVMYNPKSIMKLKIKLKQP
jgi:hypothetical protein